MSYKAHMHGDGESYSGIVPAKQPNKGGRPPAEVVEGRTLTKENTDQPKAEHRIGKAGQTGWTVCGKQQEEMGSCGSPVCYTM